MPAFADLSHDEQVRRLTVLAGDALSRYPLTNPTLSLVAYINNAVFRVDAAEGGFVRRYALRVHRPGHKRLSWVSSELVWLNAIARDTALCVPAPIANATGELVTAVQADGRDGFEDLTMNPLPVTLFTWLEGQAVTVDDVTVNQLEAVGAFLARLHTYSAQFVPPPGFERPHKDADGLFGPTANYGVEDSSIYTPEQTAIFAAAAGQIRERMDALGTGPVAFGLIHGDFLLKNVLFQESEVCAIDFDDCAWGHYLYDLAPMLLQLKDDPQYPARRDALWRGYTNVRSLSESHRADLESMIAARLLASCRWLASNLHNPAVRARAPELLAFRAGELSRFLKTGIVASRGEQF